MSKKQRLTLRGRLTGLALLVAGLFCIFILKSAGGFFPTALGLLMLSVKPETFSNCFEEDNPHLFKGK